MVGLHRPPLKKGKGVVDDLEPDDHQERGRLLRLLATNVGLIRLLIILMIEVIRSLVDGS